MQRKFLKVDEYMDRDNSSPTVVNIDVARKRRMRNTSSATSSTSVVPQSYPRVNTDDPVLVTLFNGMIIRTRLGDLACDGIKLRTNRITAEALHPSGQFINIDNPPKVEIFLDLPLPGGELRIWVRCRIARFERVSPDEVTFTLHFLTFEGAGKAIVGHYIKLCRVPVVLRARGNANVVSLNRS